MANKSHCDLIKKGVAKWNSWREQDENADVDIDFTGADLRGVDLHRADLAVADLTKADLRGADLSAAQLLGADLTEADLTEADLTEARINWAYLFYTKLTKANLSRASFSGSSDEPATGFQATNLVKARLLGADLRGVEFQETKLREANFTGADLTEADLTEADFAYTNLTGANLTGANLSGMDLTKVRLVKANLSKANLSGANLHGTVLTETILNRTLLREAKLTKASLAKADLYKADLTGADLTGANLTNSRLVETNLKAAILKDCLIYGIAAWKLDLEEATQLNLYINAIDEPTIMVDSLEVGQFLYILLNNQKLRRVIDTIARKVVLILGRFTTARKAVLDTIRNALRQRGYLPILFDFDKPNMRNRTETVSTLAHMARFIIADITEAKSVAQELQAIVPNLPSVPVQPLLLTSDYEYAMFEHFKMFPWVLEVYCYNDVDELLACLEDKVIAPAETRAKTRDVTLRCPSGCEKPPPEGAMFCPSCGGRL